MQQIASMRLAAPEAYMGEMQRTRLIDKLLASDKRIVFVQGGSGFGKTTLLAQLARAKSAFVWLTLDGENEVFQFLNALGAATRRIFPSYDFQYSDYILLEGKNNFSTILADALIDSLDRLTAEMGPVQIILDDLHTITDREVQDLITRLLKYQPASLFLCLGSREAIWPQIVPLLLRGRIEEISQQELSFTQEETEQVTGISDPKLYALTEGWPLAVRSMQLLMKKGESLSDPAHWTGENLYSYLFGECIGGLSEAVHQFLYATSSFDSLDPAMINAVLQILHSEHILETLVSRNLFTTRTSDGHYRYHSLFREFLCFQLDFHEKDRLQDQAARYYLQSGEYHAAAAYAIKQSDHGMLREILLLSYRELIKRGEFSTLSHWFKSLEADPDTPPSTAQLLIAKGALLSSTGNFLQAEACLNQAIPQLHGTDDALYLEAMVHKARVLRNSISFDASNQLLDQLIPTLSDQTTEVAYSVFIERIYNLAWNSRIQEAFTLIHALIEACNRSGNYKLRSWYQRYLTVLYYFSGNMRQSVAHYEAALEIPEEERRFLELHSIGFCAAKSYQMMGQRERALSLMTAEISRIKSAGQYEELYMAYLFAAEITYQNAFIDQMNGITQNFEATIHYFNLSEEFSTLYRTSDFQQKWTRIHQLTYSLMFTKGPTEEILQNIFSSLEQVEDYYKTTTLARLFSYYGAIGDFQNAVKCAQLCIQIGERSNLMLLPTLAYGILARGMLAGLQEGAFRENQKDSSVQIEDQAIQLVRRYLQLCAQNGIYEYFKLRAAYDPILGFAQAHGIEPEFTNEIMKFSGYHVKKVSIETFGGLVVRRKGDGENTLKMRSKKVRELLAFLLNEGERGATKEQIRYALWSESESEDVKKLIGVTLSHLKADLSQLDIANPLVKRGNHYAIDRSDLQVDSDLFLQTIQEFYKNKTATLAQKIVVLHKGEYLPEFQNPWVLSNRLHFQKFYVDALSSISAGDD